MLNTSEILPADTEKPEWVSKMLPKKPWYLSKEPTIPEKRDTFIPCNHDGECDKTCRCRMDNVPCEKACGCFPHCDRQFQGCQCKRQGKICTTNNCVCRRFNRECDQDLCGTCGADEALDPLNRGQALAKVCSNIAMQRGLPKRTLVGISNVAGFGLFSAEEMATGDFIGEYKGEITSAEESDRRGNIYHHSGAFYEFNVNQGKTTSNIMLRILTAYRQDHRRHPSR